MCESTGVKWTALYVLSLALGVVSVLVSCLRFLRPFSLVLSSRVPFSLFCLSVVRYVILTQLGSGVFFFLFVFFVVVFLAKWCDTTLRVAGTLPAWLGRNHTANWESRRSESWWISSNTDPLLLALSLILSELWHSVDPIGHVPVSRVQPLCRVSH